MSFKDIDPKVLLLIATSFPLFLMYIPNIPPQ